jgi:glycosidase
MSTLKYCTKAISILYSGFTSAAATPWLPINADYATINVQSQLKKADLGHTLNSHAAIYSYLANLRQNEAILFGSTEFFNGTVNGDDLFGYVRVKKGNPGTMVLVNFGSEEEIADLSMMKFLPERGTVQVRSVYDPETHVDEW